ncbi:ABC transporter permease [Actinoallomurus soli]|uniref:ABC transporter permease n=1 Tax=Actinoallomurus soli TaxID=2952535 RepID=UPI002091EE60|nr:ABC transporter permease [Actinoallomurus soli]MCO5974888.1 ABC transporter permease [Actinoallomurus soli]
MPCLPSTGVGQFVLLLTALLALSIVVAALGIINTLALSVIERTREIGLLRAIGTSRRQTRRMIRPESVLIAVFGAVLGLAIGVIAGIGLQRALRGQGLNVLSVPVTTWPATWCCPRSSGSWRPCGRHGGPPAWMFRRPSPSSSPEPSDRPGLDVLTEPGTS